MDLLELGGERLRQAVGKIVSTDPNGRERQYRERWDLG
jgi:hypothetical protein